MKKIILGLIIIIGLSSCDKEGNIVQVPKTIYKINGKNMKAVKVQVSSIDAVWIFVPVDTNVNIPMSIQSTTGSGEDARQVNTVIIQ